jgi:hypothetical protein
MRGRAIDGVRMLSAAFRSGGSLSRVARGPTGDWMRRRDCSGTGARGDRRLGATSRRVDHGGLAQYAQEYPGRGDDEAAPIQVPRGVAHRLSPLPFPVDRFPSRRRGRADHNAATGAAFEMTLESLSTTLDPSNRRRDRPRKAGVPPQTSVWTRHQKPLPRRCVTMPHFVVNHWPKLCFADRGAARGARTIAAICPCVIDFAGEKLTD